MTEPGPEDRPDIQKKVFGRWINAKLAAGSTAAGRSRLITDLYFDLQDGEILLDLIATLTKKELKHEQVSLPRIRK